MITIGFTGGFFLSKPVNHFWTGFGFPFIIGGLIIRWIAILQLGKSFTVDVAITDAASLKTDGIYERVRHPSYLGMLIDGYWVFRYNEQFLFISCTCSSGISGNYLQDQC